MAVDKDKIEIGEYYTARIHHMPEIVEVMQLNSLKAEPPNPTQVYLNSVGVRTIRLNEFKAVDAGELNPIKVNESILSNMGFKTVTRDNLPIHYLGQTLITRFSLTDNNYFNQITIKAFNIVLEAHQWNELMELINTAKMDLENTSKLILGKYEECYDLNALVKRLEKNGNSFDLDEILKEE